MEKKAHSLEEKARSCLEIVQIRKEEADGWRERSDKYLQQMKEFEV